jgi:hypothetical protein
VVTEDSLPSRQHAQQLLQKSLHAIAVRAGRHTSDLRESFDAQQAAATQVHAVQAQLTRGVSERHRRCHSAQEGAAARLWRSQHRDVAAAFVQVE